MKSDKVPHESFREGFIVGYQTIRGTAAGIPSIPSQPGTPGTPGNMTPFLIGVKAGLRAAGVDIS
jgi:hypothetical protein